MANSKYTRENLPQICENKVCISNCGMHTELIFKHGYDLPEFCGFVVMKTDKGIEIMRQHYREFIKVALKYKVNIQVGTITYRASPDWAKKVH